MVFSHLKGIFDIVPNILLTLSSQKIRRTGKNKPYVSLQGIQKETEKKKNEKQSGYHRKQENSLLISLAENFSLFRQIQLHASLACSKAPKTIVKNWLQ